LVLFDDLLLELGDVLIDGDCVEVSNNKVGICDGNILGGTVDWSSPRQKPHDLMHFSPIKVAVLFSK
jgi:hypothetical protein